MSDPRPAFKLWLETEEGYVFGPGVYKLLKAIQSTGTLKEASQQLGMSYRYAWGLIRKAEEKVGGSFVDASKGGKQGGGSSSITAVGVKYIQEFELLHQQWQEFKTSYDTQGTVVKADGTEIIVSMISNTDLSKGDKVRVVKA